MRKHPPYFLFIFFFGCASSLVKSERLDTMLELKKDQELMQTSLREDSRNFEKLKDAFRKKTVQIGDSKDAVLSKIGTPVVTHPQKQGEQWVYRPAEKNAFGGEKIYLFFDSGGQLKNYQCLRTECS